MSCGELHGDGFEEHLHPPGHVHDPGPAVTPEPETAPAKEKKPPSRLTLAARAGWARHGYLVQPFAWAPAVDGGEIGLHALEMHKQYPWHAHGTFDSVLASAVAGIIAEAVTEGRNKHYKRSETYRNDIRRGVAGATAWGMAASGWGPASPVMQWAMVAGGAWFCGSYVHESWKARRAARSRKPVAALEAAPAPEEPVTLALVDPRLQKFIDRFCQPKQPLALTRCEQFRELPGDAGFVISLHFPPSSGTSSPIHKGTVEGCKVTIAQLYDVEVDAVEIGDIPDAKTARRCQVVVSGSVAMMDATENLNPKHNRWDGTSSWNPADGTFKAGLFVDGNPARYLVNTPYSGAEAGMAAGVRGGGKTGFLNIMGAEAGMAKLCRRCGLIGGCTDAVCDMQRVMAVWMGDAQAKGLSVWKGRADLTGWGTRGCAELLDLATSVADARAQQNDTLEWFDTGPDGRRRRNVGKGWFDPMPGLPLIFLILDELPKLVNDPDEDMKKLALKRIVDGIFEWRKMGIHLLLGTQMLDIDQVGSRAIRDQLKFINTVAFKCDETSSYMGGIQGDPTKLPRGIPGLGYIGSVDNRGGTKFRTKFIPENCHPGQTGVDIRHLAEVIQNTPIEYDEATREVLELYGVRHQQVLTEWSARTSGADDPATLASVPDITPLPTGGIAYKEHCDQILAALDTNPDATRHDLMKVTGLDLGAVVNALAALEANGEIVSEDAPGAA